MPTGNQSRSDDAPRAAPFCPPDRMIGTHRMDDSDDAFEPLPDLTSGRTLEDAIALLDWTAAHQPENYPAAFVAELADAGLTVMRVRTDNGPALEVSCPCDEQIMERRRRQDAIAAHFRSVDGARDAVLAHLEKNGSAWGFMHKVPQ